MVEGREVRRMIDTHTKQINGLAKAISDASINQQKREAEANQRKVVDLMSEIQGKLIDRGAAYTNLLLIGGYAGIFSIWSATRSVLTLKANVTVALAAGFSLFVFISFEIFKMLFTARRFLKNRAFLTTPLAPDQFAKRLQELQQQESRVPLSYLGVWMASVAICVVSALFAVGLLGYNFVAVLVGWPIWPC